MNRREWMKMVTAIAPAAFLWPHAASARSFGSVFIVTDDPSRTAAALRGILGTHRDRVDIRRRAISPSRQDLTLLRHGQIVDPVGDPAVDSDLKRLALELRGRREPGSVMVSVEPRLISSHGDIVFECEGRTLETVPLSGAYRSIVIPGSQGNTEFALESGELSVVRSSCRHELCKRSGPVRSGRIICAPNRLVATVGTRSSALDAVTG